MAEFMFSQVPNPAHDSLRGLDRPFRSDVLIQPPFQNFGEVVEVISGTRTSHVFGATPATVPVSIREMASTTDTSHLRIEVDPALERDVAHVLGAMVIDRLEEYARALYNGDAQAMGTLLTIFEAEPLTAMLNLENETGK